MKKIQFFVVFCVIVYAQSVSASYVTSVIDNGNNITHLPGGFIVDFNNLQSVKIYLQAFDIQDDLSFSISNNTGTGWSGFNFEVAAQYLGVGIMGPFSLQTTTGNFIDWTFYGNDPFTGLPVGADVVFNPFEEVSFGASGSIDTSITGEYSITLTPSTVPVPSAVWLFSSGLLGLAGVARRKL